MAAGIGLAVVGYTGRYVMRRMPAWSIKMSDAVKSLDAQVNYFKQNVICILITSIITTYTFPEISE